MKLVRSVLAIAAACAASLSAAQYALEIIPLRHRTVEQVLPTLRPLVEPGGALTGQGNQLIVRTSPANLADIRRVLDSIDRPLRRLQISVRFDDALEASSRGIEASGRIGNRGSRLEVQAQQSSSQADERVDQRVQVLEGSRATIFTGQSRPVRSRQLIQTPGGVVAQETIVQQDLATGFEVVPRISGENVYLELAPQRETPQSFERASTSVTGRLGEWFELGAIGSSATREDRGIASASGARAAQSRRVWVKVEEVRD
jgi:type II secretory pathway component GspD/PulD (secretin)